VQSRKLALFRVQSDFGLVLGVSRYGPASATIDADHHASGQQFRNDGRSHQRPLVEDFGMADHSRSHCGGAATNLELDFVDLLVRHSLTRFLRVRTFIAADIHRGNGVKILVARHNCAIAVSRCLDQIGIEL